MGRWTIVEYLKRDRDGWLPGSRREVILGVAHDLVRWGRAKIVELPDPPPEPPKPKAKRKRKHDTVDASADSGTGDTAGDADGGEN